MIKKMLLISPIPAAILFACLESRMRHAEAKTQADVAPVATRSAEVTTSERLALVGIQTTYAEVVDSIAPVVADQQMRNYIAARLVPQLEQLGEVRRTFLKSVQERVGFAPVISGSMWVEQRK